MLMTKKIFLASALCSMALYTQAVDYKYLTVTKTDGTSLPIDVSGGLTITFQDGDMVATNGSETNTFALTDLASMCFGESTDIVTLLMEPSITQPVKLYNISGLFIGNYTTSELKAMLKGANLKKGIYFIQMGDKTQKVIIR